MNCDRCPFKIECFEVRRRIVEPYDRARDDVLEHLNGWCPIVDMIDNSFRQRAVEYFDS